MTRWKRPSARLKLLLPVVLAVLLYPALAAERVALVIGNSDYQFLRKLSNPRNDAQAVAEKLRMLGFSLIGPSETGGVYYNLNEADFLKVRNELARRAAGAKITLLYYAGHGFQGTDGPYLLPVDAPKPAQAEDLEQLTRKSISLEQTLQRLDGKGELTIAVFDACRELPELRSAFRDSGLGETRGLDRVRSVGRNRIVVYSAAAGQFAEDGSGTVHSPYTERLLAYLAQPDWEVADMFRQVATEVGRNNGQQPEVLIQGVPPRTWYLAQSAVAPPVVAVPTPSPQPAAPAPLVVAPTPQVGQIFRDALSDGGEGPLLVVIGPGSFQMGSPEGEVGRYSDERRHSVTIEKAFALGRHEVTVGEFRRFVEATGYRTDAEKNAEGKEGCFIAYREGSNWTYGYRSGSSWKDPNFQQESDHPVVCVSWADAVAYTAWLSEETGKRYRLPTEAEWEYAARAGTGSARYWGEDSNQACRYANVADRTAKGTFSGWTIHECTDNHVYTAVVGSYSANDWKLQDMLGNVWEWTCSLYTETYDGSEHKCTTKDTGGHRAVRGGAWFGRPAWVRSATRGGGVPANRNDARGFRLARSL